MSTPPSRNRHCAYCLVPVLPENVKVCGQCHRRAYCSDECLKADWSRDGNGQQHEKWCDLNCLEEDLDWEVVPVPGKGLGVIALVPIPANSRIIVDAWRTSDTGIGVRLINDLEPAAGTFQDKVNLNSFGLSEDVRFTCARLSRINHNCAANAGTMSASESKVMILYSMKDIEKGEEICTSYIYMDDKRFAKDPIPTDGTRLFLKNTYGIVCPPDCICRDKEMQMIAKEHTQLFDNMNEWSPTHLVNPNPLMMPTIKRLVEICETVPILEGNIVDILLNAYCAARHARDMPLAKQYLERCKALAQKRYHPESEKNKRFMLPGFNMD